MSINQNNGAPPRSSEARKTSSGGSPPSDPMEHDELSEDSSPSTNRVRQGVTGHNVRYVLLLSTAAVVLAFILIYAAFSK